MRQSLLRVVWAQGGLSLVSCMAGETPPSTPTLPDATPALADSGPSCTVKQSDPSLLGWPSDLRLKLYSRSSDGVVAVRYEQNGCDVTLEILTRCIGRGPSYDYKHAPSSSVRRLNSTRDLYAELPLGAARLSAGFKNGSTVRVDVERVGIERLSGNGVSAEQLEGPDCHRATHVVSAFYLGGFSVHRGNATELSGEGSLFATSAGGKQLASVERLDEDGRHEDCEWALENHEKSLGCAAPLRIELWPIDERPACPVGSERRGDSCVAVAGVACPVGSKWDGSRCSASEDVSCPDGSEWDGEACVSKEQPICPGGTYWNGAECVAQVNTECPDGLRFEHGKGCVPVETTEGAGLTAREDDAWLAPADEPLGDDTASLTSETSLDERRAASPATSHTPTPVLPDRRATEEWSDSGDDSSDDDSADGGAMWSFTGVGTRGIVMAGYGTAAFPATGSEPAIALRFGGSFKVAEFGVEFGGPYSLLGEAEDAPDTWQYFSFYGGMNLLSWPHRDNYTFSLLNTSFGGIFRSETFGETDGVIRFGLYAANSMQAGFLGVTTIFEAMPMADRGVGNTALVLFGLSGDVKKPK